MISVSGLDYGKDGNETTKSQNTLNIVIPVNGQNYDRMVE